MPARDGTGPMGTGPAGRGLGPCFTVGRRPVGYPFDRWGYGGGYAATPWGGQGGSARPRAGFGYRWFWRQPVAQAWPGPYAWAAGQRGANPRTDDPKAEREWLSGVADDLQSDLEQVRARLKELHRSGSEE
ncbi:MAG: DUF5320 domain-containing protein [Bacillota bacterium]|nr:DUF5320 domain-containing protein [Bacillota bacterium]